MRVPDRRRVHRGVRQVRDGAGRVGTVGGAAVLAAQLATGPHLVVALPAIAIGTAGGYLTTFAGQVAPAHLRALYLLPSTGLTALALAPSVTGWAWWWEAAAGVAWTAAVWAVRPARWARRLARGAGQDAAAEADSEPAGDGLEPVYRVITPDEDTAPTTPVVDLSAGTPADRLTAWWTVTAAIAGGPAPGTRLEAVQATGPRQWSAHIVATTPGNPVPEIPLARISALTDIPEEEIHIGRVPGAGAGRRHIRVGSDDQEQDFATLWARKIAPVAMPQTTVVAVRSGHINQEENA